MGDQRRSQDPIFKKISAYPSKGTTCVLLLAKLQMSRLIIYTSSEARTSLVRWATFGQSFEKCTLACHANTDSVIWIRMNTSDNTNLPKAGSTCNTIHDRYALLADGCWGWHWELLQVRMEPTSLRYLWWRLGMGL